MSVRQIQLRNDTAANWTSVNPVLAIGEFGVETDTSKVKIGNGSTAWNSLAYTTIRPADFTAKGAILVGTGVGTFAVQTVGTDGQVLTANSAQSDGIEWTTLNALPSQTGNAGKYLTTDGTNASWATVVTDPTQDIFMLMGV